MGGERRRGLRVDEFFGGWKRFEGVRTRVAHGAMARAAWRGAFALSAHWARWARYVTRTRVSRGVRCAAVVRAIRE